MGSEIEGGDPRAELFDAIGHPTRIKILQVLNDKPMGFAELKRAVAIESSGNMSFHLTKLRFLVRTASDGNYVLTDAGKEALWSVGNITGVSIERGAELQVRRTWRFRQRIAVALIIGLLALGAVAGLEQLQIISAQQEISSQQQEIGLYVNQAHPFAIGQSASLVIGQKDFISEDRHTTPNGLYNPGQALFDSNGNLWISDGSNNRILEYKPPFSTGMDASLFIGQQSFETNDAPSPSASTFSSFSYGIAMAFDSSGNLWVEDGGNNRVLEFNPPFSSGMSAGLVIGQRSLVSDSYGTSEDQLRFPQGIAFDSKGDLWVEDSGNNRVLEFRPPFANGMNASIVVGQSDFHSSNASATQSGLSSGNFNDLAIDKSGNLWVGDAGNNRILAFKPPFNSGMSASLVIGQTNFSSREIPFNTDSCLNRYIVLDFDGTGNLWTSFNCRLLEFKPPYSVGMQPSFELGQPDFTSFAWIGGPNGIAGPVRPGFDASGNLWVPDYFQNRVLEFVSAASALKATSGGTLDYPQAEMVVVVAAIIMVVSYVGVSTWRKHPRASNRV